MKDGATLIAEERRRQVETEGWSAEHDDEHGADDMARAAACYATPDYRRSMESRVQPGSTRSPEFYVSVPRMWPWFADDWKPSPDDRVRELAKAGALIAAEIDRLQRKAAKEATP